MALMETFSSKNGGGVSGRGRNRMGGGGGKWRFSHHKARRTVVVFGPALDQALGT